MTAHVESRPKGRFGKHGYSPEEFGLKCRRDRRAVQALCRAVRNSAGDGAVDFNRWR